MNQIYRKNKGLNYLWPLRWTFGHFACYAAISLYIGSFSGIIMLFYGIIILPAIFLYVMFLLKSLNGYKAFGLNLTKGVLFLENGKERIEIELDQIQQIVKVQSSKSKVGNEMALLPWLVGAFFYYRIETIDKNYLVTSCFLGKLNAFETFFDKKKKWKIVNLFFPVPQWVENWDERV